MIAPVWLLVALLQTAPALWVERDGTDLRLSTDLAPLFDEALVRRLSSGLTTTLHLRLEVRRHPDGETVGDTWRGARVRWELWEEKVTAILDGPTGARTETWPSIPLFLQAFSKIEGVVVARGVAADDATYQARLHLEVNPLTLAQIARMRRWLAAPRPDALDPLSGSLLGSFVRFFDNFKPGVAERVLIVEGHPFRADRLPFVQFQPK